MEAGVGAGGVAGAVAGAVGAGAVGAVVLVGTGVAALEVLALGRGRKFWGGRLGSSGGKELTEMTGAEESGAVA